MIKKLFVLMFVLNIFSFSVFANSDGDIKSFIDNFSKKFESINKITLQKKKEVETFILAQQILDLNWMGNYILGKHKRSLNEQQIKNFVNEYSKFLISNYLSVLDFYTTDRYQIISVEEQKNNVFMVFTTVKYQSDKIVKNNFRIVKKDNRYYITDIITEGISFISAQRSEVNSVISSMGFEKFMEKLKAKNDNN